MVEKQIKGFMTFVREQGVVGLAVGLVLGSAIKSMVDSMVANIINPIVGLLLGGVTLTEKALCLHVSNGVCTSRLAWGSFLSTVISFITIAAVVYFGVKGLHLDRLDIKKSDEVAKESTKSGKKK